MATSATGTVCRIIRLSYCLEPFRDVMSRPVALVTGGGQGIGAATCTRLAMSVNTLLFQRVQKGFVGEYRGYRDKKSQKKTLSPSLPLPITFWSLQYSKYPCRLRIAIPVSSRRVHLVGSVKRFQALYGVFLSVLMFRSITVNLDMFKRRR